MGQFTLIAWFISPTGPTASDRVGFLAGYTTFRFRWETAKKLERVNGCALRRSRRECGVICGDDPSFAGNPLATRFRVRGRAPMNAHRKVEGETAR